MDGVTRSLRHDSDHRRHARLEQPIRIWRGDNDAGGQVGPAGRLDQGRICDTSPENSRPGYTATVITLSAYPHLVDVARAERDLELRHIAIRSDDGKAAYWRPARPFGPTRVARHHDPVDRRDEVGGVEVDLGDLKRQCEFADFRLFGFDQVPGTLEIRPRPVGRFPADKRRSGDASRRSRSAFALDRSASRFSNSVLADFISAVFSSTIV